MLNMKAQVKSYLDLDAATLCNAILNQDYEYCIQYVNCQSYTIGPGHTYDLVL